MTRTREAWAVAIDAGDYRIVDLADLVNDWKEAEEKAMTLHEKAMQEEEDERHDVEDERDKLLNCPEWGNCRRGCPPAYLDRDGFCSPACYRGAPRGEYVTLPRELVVSAG